MPDPAPVTRAPPTVEIDDACSCSTYGGVRALNPSRPCCEVRVEVVGGDLVDLEIETLGEWGLVAALDQPLGDRHRLRAALRPARAASSRSAAPSFVVGRRPAATSPNSTASLGGDPSTREDQVTRPGRADPARSAGCCRRPARTPSSCAGHRGESTRRRLPGRSPSSARARPRARARERRATTGCGSLLEPHDCVAQRDQELADQDAASCRIPSMYARSAPAQNVDPAPAQQHDVHVGRRS